MKGVRVRDLPPYPRVGESRGDYFVERPDRIVRHCGLPLQRVIKRIVYGRVF